MTIAGTPYQSLERLKMRLEYEATDIFDDRDNAEKRFDRLLMGTAEVGDGEDFDGLEAEARTTIESYAGGQVDGDFDTSFTFVREVDRQDEIRATEDTSISLIGPVVEISTVEIKRTLRSDWHELNEHRWDRDNNRLVLSYGSRVSRARHGRRRNVLTDEATRATWRDICEKMRVTYTRGYEPVPATIRSVQVRIINRMLRNLVTEQTIQAMEPDQIAAVTSAEAVITEDIEMRIRELSPLGGSIGSV